MQKIVGLTGFSGAGKTEAANYLQESCGFKSISFADTIKDCVAAIFCWSRDMVEGTTPESREWRNTVDKWWAEKLNIPDLTPLKMINVFGTDIMRKYFDEKIWIYNVEKRIADIDNDIIFPDLRRELEFNTVRGLGGKIHRIKRGPEPVWYYNALMSNKINDPALMQRYNVHPIIWNWVGLPIDSTIENDGTIADLQQKVKQAVYV